MSILLILFLIIYGSKIYAILTKNFIELWKIDSMFKTVLET